MMDKELNREGLAKLAFDRGQISQDTYNRMVPPINPEAPVLEATNLLPDAVNVTEVIDKVYPGVGTLATKAGDAIGSAIAGGENMPGINNAMAEVPLRNPALDQAPEPIQGLLTSDKMQAPQSGQASSANPLAGLEGAMGKQKNAIMGAAKIGAEAAAAEAGYQEKMFQESEKMRINQAEIDAQRATKLKSYEDMLNSKMDEYAKKPANVAQVFANAGTGQKLLMGFAMFLGAAPNSTGQNKAISAMQASIDADLAKAKSETGDRKNAYQEMKETFKDERQADAAARIAYLNNAQMKLNQIASQYKGPQILENAKLLSGKIDEEIQKNKLQFMAAAQGSSQFQNADEMTQKIMQYPKERQKELLESREVYDATEKAKSDIDGIYDNFDIGAMGYVPFTDSKAKLETTHAQIESAIRATMRGQGTIQETEIVRLVNPFLPLPTDSEDRLKIKRDQLKALLENKNAGQINRLRNAGILQPQKKFSEAKTVRSK
jgi:hypothetical protein